SSEGVTMRAFTQPLPLDKRTTLTNSFTIGNTWNSVGTSGPVALATLSLDHTFPGGGALTASYDFVHQPIDLFNVGGQHRLSLTYSLAASKKVQVSFFSSSFLDAPQSSVLGDVAYVLNKNWRVLFSATLQRFNQESFNDLELTLGRRIGARELQLTYSTYRNRISLDFTTTRF
ncbi:MAG TPA: hypothetical protein VGS41_06390, partial [Chthonomonadales bacterium]|nr:hypothetical protein [Chthonomonadales bacterium]